MTGRRRAVVLAMLTVVLAIVASSAAVHEAVLGVFRAADEVLATHPVLGTVLFVALAALSAMFAFLSSAVLVPAALVVWGKPLTFALLWLGWSVGGATAYAIARFLGRPVVAALTSSSGITRYEERISRGTSFGVILLFQLGVPSEVPGYVLGFLRYPFRRYLAALALGELPYAAGAVYLGASFLERRMLLLVVLGALAAAASLAALQALHRRLAAPTDDPVGRGPPGG